MKDINKKNCENGVNINNSYISILSVDSAPVQTSGQFVSTYEHIKDKQHTCTLGYLSIS